jgi:hypothetical protein
LPKYTVYPAKEGNKCSLRYRFRHHASKGLLNLIGMGANPVHRKITTEALYSGGAPEGNPVDALSLTTKLLISVFEA